MRSAHRKLNLPLSLCFCATFWSTFRLKLHAEPGTISNVTGDEIVIQIDENPPSLISEPSAAAPRNLQNDYGIKETVRKPNVLNLTPSYASPSYASPSYTSPNYNSETVLAKPKRNFNLEEILDVAPNQASQLHTNEDVNRNDLWQRIKNGYAIPDSTSPLTRTHESWYSSRPDYVRRMVERSQRLSVPCGGGS